MTTTEQNLQSDDQVATVVSACVEYSGHFGNIHQQSPDTPFITMNNDGTATAKFTTTISCVEVSFSSYTYTSTPEPYEEQVHFDGNTLRIDEPGSYEIIIKVKACGKSQLDLYAGPLQETLHPGHGHDHLTLRNFLLVSTTDCIPVTSTPPTTTPTTTPTSTPTSTPTTTPTTTPTSTPTSTPTITPTTTPTTTPTSTPTITPTTTPTSTPTSTPTITPTVTPTVTPTDPPEPTPTEHTVTTVTKLPKTGDTNTMPYYLLGSALTLAGIVSLRKRKERK